MRIPKTAAATVLTASLALGAVGATAASAADAPPPRLVVAGDADGKAPVPDAERLARQAEALRKIGGTFEPVADLLADVLRARHGKLSKAQANDHSRAVRSTLETITPPQEPRSEAAKAEAKAAETLAQRADALARAAVSAKPEKISKEAGATVAASAALLRAIERTGGLPQVETLPAPTGENARPGADEQLPESQTSRAARGLPVG
ncbi:hypothetical protein [Streptomyces sp. NPDC005438]|uniref:hypothetical protein n=1 Tax=Streptomyces sp. NPDC005438 TaxID=3156880 RepID=UPI0033BA2993